MPKIVPLFEDANVTAGGSASQEVIDLLKLMLAEAERGEIDGIAIALSRPNDSIGSCWVFGSARFRLIAAVELLKGNILAHMRDIEE